MTNTRCPDTIMCPYVPRSRNIHGLAPLPPALAIQVKRDSHARDSSASAQIRDLRWPILATKGTKGCAASMPWVTTLSTRTWAKASAPQNPPIRADTDHDGIA
ncbi:MAG: hypothetical protein GDA36_13825 [Rhodobacteraceae bacterium]|nr:hypothetical protein [Paracoccaceae bacterium]